VALSDQPLFGPPPAWSEDLRRSEEAARVLRPLLVLEHVLWRETALRPTAVMLPGDVLAGATWALGLPVIRGDRAALLLEPPR